MSTAATAASKTASKRFATTWRFAAQQRKPLLSLEENKKLRVLFAGHQFPAGFQYTQREIARRGASLANKIQLLQAPTRDDLLRLAKKGNIHVALPFMERFDATFITSASDSLLMIQQFGVGLEGVDIDTATRLGIAVCNVPAKLCYNAQATAEHALLLTLMLLRGAHNSLPRQLQQRQLGGGWSSTTTGTMPQTLFRQRVTVVGYGAVGSTLCRYLVTLGAQVTAVRRSWDNTNNDDDHDSNVHGIHHDSSSSSRIKQSTNLDDELPTTAILILCCSLNAQTQHLMNEHRLQVLLPRGALVINVGRGPLVEYNAIYQAVVHSNHVAGFASDVGVGDGNHANKPAEPWDPHDALSQHDNTIFTPHVGGNCHVVVENMAKIVVDNLERILLLQPPHHWVNQYHQQQQQEEELPSSTTPGAPPIRTTL